MFVCLQSWDNIRWTLVKIQRSLLPHTNSQTNWTSPQSKFSLVIAFHRYPLLIPMVSSLSNTDWVSRQKNSPLRTMALCCWTVLSGRRVNISSIMPRNGRRVYRNVSNDRHQPQKLNVTAEKNSYIAASVEMKMNSLGGLCEEILSRSRSGNVSCHLVQNTLLSLAT